MNHGDGKNCCSAYKQFCCRRQQTMGEKYCVAMHETQHLLETEIHLERRHKGMGELRHHQIMTALLLPFPSPQLQDEISSTCSLSNHPEKNRFKEAKKEIQFKEKKSRKICLRAVKYWRARRGEAKGRISLLIDLSTIQLMVDWVV